jgi:hypothetical protein
MLSAPVVFARSDGVGSSCWATSASSFPVTADVVSDVLSGSQALPARRLETPWRCERDHLVVGLADD